MPPEQSSAEKELLKIIEGSPGSGKKDTGLAKMADLSKKGGATSAGKDNVRTGAKKTISIKALLADRKIVIRLLTIVTFWVVVIFVVTFIREFIKMQNMKNLQPVYQSSKNVSEQASKDYQDDNQATEEAESQEQPLRNVFKPVEVKKVEEVKSESEVAFQDLKLVGLAE